MIPKREILLRSQEWSLRPEVVEKDYVLGWMLAAILRDVAETTETLRGVQCPRAGVGLEPRRNKAGDRTYEGSIEYRGPLAVPTGPKIRFDITKHERTFPPFERREVLHSYPDELPTSALVQTYSLEELVAEKSRTLIERSRPRDLYDVVHLGQHRRDELDADRKRQLFHEKCTAKGIPDPDPRRDRRARRAVGRSAADWKGMLAHQLPALPDPSTFVAMLRPEQPAARRARLQGRAPHRRGVLASGDRGPASSCSSSPRTGRSGPSTSTASRT